MKCEENTCNIFKLCYMEVSFLRASLLVDGRIAPKDNVFLI